MTEFEVTLPASLAHRSQIALAAERLVGITGFVTIVCGPGDPRPSVFNRRDHVARVDLAAQLIMDLVVPAADREFVREVVWLHDLNRWPFAHNLEKGRYDQAADVPRFLADRGLVPSEPLVQAIRTIHGWRFDTRDPDALVALAADKVAGMVEDILFAVSGLNIRPGHFPFEVWELMGMGQGGRASFSALEDLVRYLHVGRDLSAFRHGFQTLFQAAARHVVSSLSEPSEADPTGLRRCVKEIRRIRTEVVAPQVFPVNNELVCRRSLLADRVFSPLFDGDHPPRAQDLLSLDDEAAAALWSPSPHSGESAVEFVPDLDVVTRTRPDLVFVDLNRL